MNKKSTKKGKLLEEELLSPMIHLAKRNRAMGIEKLSKINAKMIEDWVVLQNRKPGKLSCHGL